MENRDVNPKPILIAALITILILIIVGILSAQTNLFNTDTQEATDDKKSYDQIKSGHNHNIPAEIEDIFYTTFEEYFDNFKEEQTHATKLDLNNDQEIFESALLYYWRPFLPIMSDQETDGLILRNEKARLEIYEFLKDENIEELLKKQLEYAQQDDLSYPIRYENASWSEIHDAMNPYYFGSERYTLGNAIYQTEEAVDIGDMRIHAMVIKPGGGSEDFNIHFEMQLSMVDGQPKTLSELKAQGLNVVSDDGIVFDIHVHDYYESTRFVDTWGPEETSVEELIENRTLILNNAYQPYTLVMNGAEFLESLDVDGLSGNEEIEDVLLEHADALPDSLNMDIEYAGELYPVDIEKVIE